MGWFCVFCTAFFLPITLVYVIELFCNPFYLSWGPPYVVPSLYLSIVSIGIIFMWKNFLQDRYSRAVFFGFLPILWVCFLPTLYHILYLIEILGF